MKCVIAAGNVTILGRAVHSLAKIAEELCFEGQDDKLVLHAVTTSRSAYSRFYFANSFFTSYEPSNVTHCKMTVRSCLLPFKSVNNLEKKVHQCSLQLTDKNLLVQLQCKHGIVKAYELPSIEAEIRNPPFPVGNWKNVLTAHSRLLSDAVHNFGNSIEEVTLKLTQSKLVLSNYTEDEPDPSAVVHTELSIDLAEFDESKIGERTDITFCLKELKAALGFSEGMNAPMTISFDSAGRPVIFSIKANADVQTDFVLSTLAEASNDRVQLTRQENINDTQRTSEQINSVRLSGNKRTMDESRQDRQESLENNVAMVDRNNPPSKKLCTLFSGLRKGSKFSSLAQEPQEILASATDDEDDEDEMII